METKSSSDLESANSKRIALIKNNVVESIANWDGDPKWIPDPSYVLVDVTSIKCDIGWTFDGDKSFTAPVQLPEVTTESRLATLEKDVAALKAAK